MTETVATIGGMQGRHVRAALWLVTLLIAYGSLYPFRFESPGPLGPALVALLGDWGGDGRLTDVLGNIALFAPFGALAVLTMGSRISALAAALGLALALQVAQLWLPARTAALSDVGWNGVGALMGVIAAPWLARLGSRAILQRAALSPAALLALWLLAETVPLVPGLGWQEIKDSIKPLWQAPRWDSGWFLVELSMGLAALELLRTLRERRSIALELGLLGCVLLAQVLVMARTLELTTVAAFAVAWLLYAPLGARRRPIRRALVAVALLAGFSLEALLPLRPAAVLGSFHWVPFATFLSGSTLVAAINGARLVFTFAVLLWLLRQGGGRLGPGASALGLWVFLIELAQLPLQGRVADITPVVLVALAAGMVGWLERWQALGQGGAGAAPLGRPCSARHRAGGAGDCNGPGRTAGEGRGAERRGRAARAVGGRGLVVAGAGLVLFLALAMVVFVNLPGVPYNLTELFRGEPLMLYAIVFALALLWLGAGPALMARRLADSPRAWLELPLLTMGVSLVSLLLLSLSVTGESLLDIVGSNNLNWFIIHRQIWGEWAAEAFRRLDAPAMVALIERPVRFTALIGPLIMALALFGALAYAKPPAGRAVRRWLLLVAAALPWFWLCKAIAFDWSSTDNLNELIARQGAWGTGGGLYLYLLLVLFSAHGVGLARVATRRHGLVALLGTAAALPLSWWLLNAGLEPEVRKYGHVFSGAQFLLGPDRAQLLPPSELLLRWAVVYLGGVAVVAAGHRLGIAAALWAARRLRTTALGPTVDRRLDAASPDPCGET